MSKLIDMRELTDKSEFIDKVNTLGGCTLPAEVHALKLWIN